MSALKRRIEKLETSQPEISPLSHLSDEELEVLLVESRQRIDAFDCPNCKGCTTQSECKELQFKLKETEKRLGII